MRRPAPVTVRREARTSRLGVVWTFFAIFVVATLLSVFVVLMQRRWTQGGQRAVLLIEPANADLRQRLSIVLTQPGQRQAVLLRLPPNQGVATFQQGQYESDALAGFIRLEKMDWAQLRLLVGLQYGVAVDDIVWVRDEVTTWPQVQAALTPLLWAQLPTTLTYADRWQLWWQVRRIPAGAVQVPDLSRWQLETGILDTSAYDRAVSRWLEDAQIRASGMTVAVENGTPLQGLGGRVARALTLLGFEVVAVDSVAPTEKSMLLRAEETSNAASRWGESRLRTLIPQLPKSTQDQAHIQLRRSDWVVVLGQDIMKTKITH